LEEELYIGYSKCKVNVFIGQSTTRTIYAASIRFSQSSVKESDYVIVKKLLSEGNTWGEAIELRASS